jgi:hypothetical protein
MLIVLVLLWVEYLILSPPAEMKVQRLMRRMSDEQTRQVTERAWMIGAHRPVRGPSTYTRRVRS